VDDQVPTVVEQQDDQFQQVPGSIGAEPQLPRRLHVLAHRVGDERVRSGVHGVLAETPCSHDIDASAGVRSRGRRG
jgi:hypothetical protein